MSVQTCRRHEFHIRSLLDCVGHLGHSQKHLHCNCIRIFVQQSLFICNVKYLLLLERRMRHTWVIRVENDILPFLPCIQSQSIIDDLREERGLSHPALNEFIRSKIRLEETRYHHGHSTEIHSSPTETNVKTLFIKAQYEQTGKVQT